MALHAQLAEGKLGMSLAKYAQLADFEEYGILMPIVGFLARISLDIIFAEIVLSYNQALRMSQVCRELFAFSILAWCAVHFLPKTLSKIALPIKPCLNSYFADGQS